MMGEERRGVERTPADQREGHMAWVQLSVLTRIDGGGRERNERERKERERERERNEGGGRRRELEACQQHTGISECTPVTCHCHGNQNRIRDARSTITKRGTETALLKTLFFCQHLFHSDVQKQEGNTLCFFLL